MFKSQKGKNLAAVVFKVNVIMNHQCKDIFFLLEFLSFVLSVSQLLLQQKKKGTKPDQLKCFNQLFS